MSGLAPQLAPLEHRIRTMEVKAIKTDDRLEAIWAKLVEMHEDLRSIRKHFADETTRLIDFVAEKTAKPKKAGRPRIGGAVAGVRRRGPSSPSAPAAQRPRT